MIFRHFFYIILYFLDIKSIRILHFYISYKHKFFWTTIIQMGQKQSLTTPQIIRSNSHQDQKGITIECLQEISMQTHLKSFKHRSIGKIVFTRKLKKYSGTVTIISKDIALTSAHNIYDKRYNCQYTDFNILCMGEGGEVQEYGIEAHMFPQRYRTCPQDDSSIECDYALVKLAPNQKYSIDYEQFLKVSVPCEECLMRDRNQLPLQVYGYISSSPEPLKQFGMTRKSTLKSMCMEQSKLQYTINTCPGQSGAPIIINGQEIIGIYKGASIQEECNLGTLISYKMLDDLKKWTEQLKGNPIKVGQSFPCSHLQDCLQKFKQSKPKDNTKQLQSFLQKKQNDQYLTIYNQNINSINLTINKKIKILILTNNNLKEIDVSNNNLLQIIRLENNKIETIVFPAINTLRQLWMQTNRLTKINLTNTCQLTHLNLSHNLIAQINLTNNVKLTFLDMAYNGLENIGLNTNIDLIQLSLSYNRLKALNLKETKKLKTLFVASNQLRQIDLSNNLNIVDLLLKDNKLEKVICWYQKSRQSPEVYIGRQSFKQIKQCIIKLLHYKDQGQSCFEWTKRIQQKLRESIKTGYSEIGNTQYKFELEERT